MKARILEMLQRIPIFGGIADEALEHVLNKAQDVSLQKGEFFFREGERAQSMYVLVEGRVAIVKTSDGREFELSRLGPGDCFGELELIDFCPRAASVRGIEDCRAIEISATVLHEVYKIDQTSYAMLQMNMGREVSRRLRKLDEDLFKVKARADDTEKEEATMNGGPPNRETDTETKRCKVCTKHIRPDEEHWEVWHGEAKFDVCCPLCAARFREKPELYLVT